ncbi:hypothetical protein [Flavobacterium aurantiibacter]|uniref:Uncharacterized protein n=1 Tax=Flavobacterium aurantiibacter TaxID=2023067 RepID=A0A256A8K0_9FLAO|nr:hypothetical protein [Flavobacterium aurantiibacter]OYQ50028.1 hypothetical protein CHX27_01050 [Flavobacterium aurantiibacter]
MKPATLLSLLSFLVVISCSKINSSENVIIFENSNYKILTSKKKLETYLNNWLERQKNNPYMGIKKDQELYDLTFKQENKGQINLYEIAKNRKLSDRLLFVAANLIDQKNVIAFNKQTNDEVIILSMKEKNTRIFSINKEIIFEVVDYID